jgi:hypothetical protein
MIKNKIKLLQLLCFLYAGEFADMMNKTIDNLKGG